MIDEFAELIFHLNERARDLLEDATALDKELEEGDASDPHHVERMQKLMNNLCAAMKKVVGILEGQRSPLDRFFDLTRGVRMVPDVADALNEFLKAHEQQLQSMGITDQQVIDKLKKLLEEAAAGNIDEPVKVEQPTKDKDGKEVGILADIRKLQELICGCAAAIDVVANAPNVLRACVKGVMGTAAIAVDITGLFTVPDVTGWVLFKAVKSTWTGWKLVKEAIGTIEEGLNALNANTGRANVASTARKTKGKYKV